MSFVSPMFLWALLALAVPVIIHLFNFRRYKKVYFTNVRFLRELQEETKSRSRLRELLILASRCLALACLVIAFARPYVETGGDSLASGGVVSIYVDNSFSMQNVSKQGPLLDVARLRAREIVRAAGANARFHIITNDFEGRHQRLITREDAAAVLDEIAISPAVRPVSEVLRRQQEFLKPIAGSKRVYLISDLQRSTFDAENLSPDTNISINIVPLSSVRMNNMFVDSCWFDSPFQQKGFVQTLNVRITNRGNSAIEATTARLKLNGAQVSVSSYSLAEDDRTTVKFRFECRTSGFNYGSIDIDDYPVTFDDELFMAFNSRVSISVCLINGSAVKAGFFTSLFSKDSLFAFREMNESVIDYAAFGHSDVIILNQPVQVSSGLTAALKGFLGKGGALVIVPPSTGELNGLNELIGSVGLPALGAMDTAATRTARIETALGFFSGVFEKTNERVNLPVVKRHYRLQSAASAARPDYESLMQLENGSDLLSAASYSNGQVYLFSTPFTDEATNFFRHALFVPVFYQVAFHSMKPAPLYYETGKDAVIRPPASLASGESPPRIAGPRGIEIIPEKRVSGGGWQLHTRGQVREPGFYRLMSDTTSVMPMAFNYQRRESDLQTMGREEITSLVDKKGWKKVKLLELSEGGGLLATPDAGNGNLWKLFIFLALVFLAAEVSFLKLLK